jgi:hypothetical protein
MEDQDLSSLFDYSKGEATIIASIHGVLDRE